MEIHLEESPNQWRRFWMKEGDMPALSSWTQTQTQRELAEYFLRLSAEVDGRNFFTALQNKCSNPAAGDEQQWGFLGSVTVNWHVFQLCKMAGSYDHLQCSLDGAYHGVLHICREFDLLAILTVLLDAPDDLYGCCKVE
jgi:hypothetical protein